MSKRDLFFLKVSFLILFVVFAKLLIHPGSIPGNFGDIYGYHYPLRHLVAATLQEGRLPLWNPYIFAGTPLAANPQAVLFYPASALHYFFTLSWAFSLDVFFHLSAAVFGAHFLLRKLRIDRLGSWTLSLCYGLSPFLVYRISQGVPTLLAALSWVPWVWLTASSGRPIWLGSAIALQILSGHAQFCAINLLMLGGWILWSCRGRFIFFLKGCLCAGLLAAVQILPTLQFLRHSIRTMWNPAFSLGYSLKLPHLLTLLYPNAWGNPLQSDFRFFPSEFFEMMTNYIGLLPLAMACYGLFRVRSARVLAAFALAGIFLALGKNNPLFIQLQKVFGLDFFRIPARFSFLAVWSLWLAAVAGWRDLRPNVSWKLRGALAALGVMDLLCWSGPWVYAQNPAGFLSSNPAVVQRIRNPRCRIATSPDIPAPDKSMLHRILNVTGYEAFYLAPIAVYTARSEQDPGADGSRTYIRKWDTPEMSRLGVRYYIATEPMPGREPALRQGGAFVYENRDAGELVASVGSDIQWAMASPEHWIVRAHAPQGPVTFSQANYPGWRAWVNGKEVSISDEGGMFPTVSAPVSASESAVLYFRFLPGLWRAGLLTTLIALLAAASFVIFRLELKLFQS